jgi:cytosine/adenosine deaminase-related metal-dependent hydrolase
MFHGWEGKVTAVHSISLAAHPKHYRQKVYSMAKDAGLSFVCCPIAWIDHRRTENMSVTHNAITPVDELVENDLVVAMGTDNINDVYKPYNDGNMMTELRFLLEALHIYDEQVLMQIMTENGRKVISDI